MYTSEQGFLKAKGRISRINFLARYFWLAGFSNFTFAGIISAAENNITNFLIFILVLLWLLLNITIFIQAVKRAHDIGKSGWILFIPFYNFIVFFKKGENINNKYGPSTTANQQYDSNIIFNDKPSELNSVRTMAWLGFLFYIVSLIFIFWISRPQIDLLQKDSDGDGVINILDKCPDVVGLKENEGCPAALAELQTTDTDNDGVPNKTDMCPTIPGTQKNNGCPENKPAPNKDSDRDGVADKSDMCPNKYGTIANNGCPEIKVITGSSISILRQNIQNETANVSIDMSTVKLNTDNYSFTYSTGREKFDNISLIYDPDANELQRRIQQYILPKNQDKTTKILVNSTYNAKDKLYCSVLGFQ